MILITDKVNVRDIDLIVKYMKFIQAKKSLNYSNITKQSLHIS